MANTHGILAVIAAIFAALTALVVFDLLLIVPAGFAVVAGILIAIQQKDSMLVMAGGVLGAVIGLVVVIGTLMGWLEATLGGGLAILANIEIVVTALKAQWGNLPQAGAIGSAVTLGLAALTSVIFASHLALSNIPITIVVAVFCLGGLYPAMAALKA